MRAWRWLGLRLGCVLVFALAIACGRAVIPPPVAPSTAVQVQGQEAVPAYVRQTLTYIRQHGDAPPGFVGGRVFGNYEGVLPRFEAPRKRIAYREWDVHPRAVGRNRGAERLVTGNDGRAWYTHDHYRTFLEVK